MSEEFQEMTRRIIAAHRPLLNMLAHADSCDICAEGEEFCPEGEKILAESRTTGKKGGR